MSMTADVLSTNTTTTTSTTPVIEVRDLRKAFGEKVAVAGLSLSVEAGSILGLLGPNGAGKTTTIRMLTTLLPIDGGTATVAGFDVATQPGLVRQAIGLAGQSAAVDEMLTTRQNLDLFGRLYHLSSSERRARAEGLIDRFQMTEFADRLAGALSGGEKRRLDLVAALIADPPAVFLDEPTTGLDPRGRAALWDEIKAVRDDGAAVVLTTQYLDEADRLADRIVVIDRGTAVAQGTAAELKAHFRRDVLELTVADPGSRAAAAETLGGSNVIAVDDRTLHLVVNTAQESLAALRAVQDADIEVADFQLRRPTLDDVFIELTGAPTMPAESTGSTRSEAEEVTRP